MEYVTEYVTEEARLFPGRGSDVCACVCVADLLALSSGDSVGSAGAKIVVDKSVDRRDQGLARKGSY